MIFITTLPFLFVADVSVYSPTPMVVAERMLEIAEIDGGDVVYDLGSGDGRLVILASMIYECRSIGVELDEELVNRAKRNVSNNNVEKLVEIKQGDVLKTDFRDADVVLIYLMPGLLRKLNPKFKTLRDGVKIIAHDKAIPGICVDEEYEIEDKSMETFHKIFVYVTPLREIKCKGGT